MSFYKNTPEEEAAVRYPTLTNPSGWEGWAEAKTVTTDPNEIGSDVANWVLKITSDGIAVDDPIWTGEDGDSLRVTESDGTTELPIDVDFFDAVNKRFEIYVLMTDPIDSSIAQELKLYHSNATESAYDPTDTYGRNNVWQYWKRSFTFSELPSAGLTDHCGSGFDGTAGGMTDGDRVDSGTGFAWNFDGSSKYVSLSHDTSVATMTEGYITAIVQPDSSTGNDSVFNIGATTANRFAVFAASPAGASYTIKQFIYWSSGSGRRIAVSDNSFANSSAKRISLSSFNSDRWDFYADGSLEAKTMILGGDDGTFFGDIDFATASGVETLIGRDKVNGAYGDYLAGDIVELRIHATPQDANFEALLNNQDNILTIT